MGAANKAGVGVGVGARVGFGVDVGVSVGVGDGVGVPDDVGVIVRVGVGVSVSYVGVVVGDTIAIVGVGVLICPKFNHRDIQPPAPKDPTRIASRMLASVTTQPYLPIHT